MKLTQISKELTPELFFSAKDLENNWIETEQFDYQGGIKLRKRCLNGWQDLNLSYGVMQVYFVPEIEQTIDDITNIVPDEANAVLTADGFLRPQKMDWGINDWVDMPFAPEHMSVIFAEGDYDAQAVYDNGIDRVQIDIAWRISNSKQRYRVAGTIGDYVRMSAAVTDYKVEGIDVKQSIADFMGFALTQVYDNPDGTETTLYVFESDGQEITASKPVFEVDPYISLDEQAIYIDVTCDGFIFRLYPVDSGYGPVYEVRDLSGTVLIYSSEKFSLSDGTNTYNLANSTDRVVTFIEESETRIIIKQSTTYDRTGGTTDDYLQDGVGDANPVDLTFTIYLDRIAFKYQWVTENTITLSTYHPIQFLQCRLNNITNPVNIYEVSGSEGSGDVYTEKNAADYIGATSDEINVWIANTFSTISLAQSLSNAGNLNFFLADTSGSLSAGTHICSFEVIIDSAERESIQPTTTWTDTNFSVGDLVVNDSIGYECISAVTSGNSAVTEPGTGTGWNTYWKQCHGYTSAQRLEQGNQYKDTDLALTNGTAITSGAGVTSIGNYGFGSDGAFHWII